MIFTFVAVLVATILLNWYIILFGKKDLEQLKAKLSIKKYLAEMGDAMEKAIGRAGSICVQLGFVVLSGVIVIANAFLFMAGIGGFVLGVFLAKKSYQVGSISNVLRRIAIYINRVR